MKAGVKSVLANSVLLVCVAVLLAARVALSAPSERAVPSDMGGASGGTCAAVAPSGSVLITAGASGSGAGSDAIDGTTFRSGGDRGRTVAGPVPGTGEPGHPPEGWARITGARRRTPVSPVDLLMADVESSRMPRQSMADPGGPFTAAAADALALLNALEARPADSGKTLALAAGAWMPAAQVRAAKDQQAQVEVRAVPEAAAGGQFRITHVAPNGKTQTSGGTTPHVFAVRPRSSFSITNIQYQVQGYTYAGPTTVAGMAGAAGETVVVTLNYQGTAPSITVQPVNTTKVACEPVTFSAGASGSAPLSYQWQKNTTNIPGATSSAYTIPSVVSGDAGSYRMLVTNCCGSAVSNAATLTVNRASSRTAITSSINPSVYGQPVTFAAAVGAVSPMPVTPTGTVQFKADGGPIGSPVSLQGGQAATSSDRLPVGTHAIGADYSGDTNFLASSGALPNQTVNRAETTTTIGSDQPDPSAVGQTYTVNVSVKASGPGAGSPSRTVAVMDGMGATCVAAAPAGGCSLASSSAGGTNLTATYAGDNNFNGSTAPPAAHETVQAATAVALTSAANPSVFGQPLTFTAVVSVVAPGAGQPTGMIEFVADGNPIGSQVTLSEGSATSQVISSLAVGTHTITASYSGDRNFRASGGELSGQVVNNAWRVRNPYPASSNRYKGSIHSHSLAVKNGGVEPTNCPGDTGGSDGTECPSVTAAMLAPHGDHFWIPTDHDTLTTVGSSPGILTINSGAEQYCARTPGGHINVLGVTAKIPSGSPNPTCQQVIDDAHAHGGIAVINHPAMSQTLWTADQIAALNGVDAVEVYSWDASTGADLTIAEGVLDRGKHICLYTGEMSGPGNADFHAVKVYAASLTQENIMAGLKACSLTWHASNVANGAYPDLVMSYDDATHTITAAAGSGQTGTFTWRKKGGDAKERMSCSSAPCVDRYTITGTESYVYVKFTSSTHVTNVAGSNPFWIEPY